MEAGESADPAGGGAGLSVRAGYLRASPEIFAYVARADIEVAAADDGEPQPLLTVSLSPQVPSAGGCWTRCALPAGACAGEPSFMPMPRLGGRPSTAHGRPKIALAATVTLPHVYPQRARRIVARAQFSDLAGVQGITCQFSAVPSVRRQPGGGGRERDPAF